MNCLRSKGYKNVGIILVVSLLLMSACARQPVKTSAAEATREAHWQQDLTYLVQELPEYHPNLFFSISQSEFQQEVEQLKQNIPTMKDDEIVLGLARIVASIGDTHTRLDLRQNATGFSRYPFKFYWFPSGIVVTDTTPEYKQALGARLIKIGDTDISAVTDKIGKLISHENEQSLKSLIPENMNIPEVLYGLNITTTDNNGRFVFVDTTGQTITLNVQALSDPSKFNGIAATVLPKPPLYRQNNNKYYWYTYLPDSQTLYLQYNACFNSKDQPFDDFASELLTFVDKHPVKRFVIDLRSNTGGYANILEPLITGILERPSLNQKGHLFALIGRSTFSSAMQNAYELQNGTNVILVGEPTGGKPNSYSNVSEFQLPNSKLTVSCSMKYITNTPDNIDSLQPDVNVTISAADYLAGIDPVMETILKYPQK